MFQRVYFIEFAIADAAKAAYLVTCFQHGRTIIEKYDGPKSISTTLNINPPLNTKLRKLKSSNPEAYFYWAKISELL